MAKFVYFICNSGSASLLKEELKRKHPYFNVAFSRQTFLTFKRADGLESRLDFDPRCVFARAFGISLGKVKKSEIGKVLQSELNHLQKENFILHEWSLDESPSWSVRQELKDLFTLQEKNIPSLGDYIIEIIKIGENDFFLGLRKHSFWQTPFVGGIPDFILPTEAPSRAWLKTEEALHLSKAELRPGEIVLEIGSAPGGSVFNFLNRKMKVYGVDTAEMHQVCLQHPSYTHLSTTMQKIDLSKIKGKVRWLAIDINQKPSYALRELRILLPDLQKDLLGMFLTFKLTDGDSIKRIDGNIKELQDYKMNVLATQLYHNRNEIFLYVVPNS